MKCIVPCWFFLIRLTWKLAMEFVSIIPNIWNIYQWSIVILKIEIWYLQMATSPLTSTGSRLFREKQMFFLKYYSYIIYSIIYKKFGIAIWQKKIWIRVLNRDLTLIFLLYCIVPRLAEMNLWIWYKLWTHAWNRQKRWIEI